MRKGEWRYWGGDAGSTRYSALDQINATNARKLEIAWRWQSLPGDGEPDVELQSDAADGRRRAVYQRRRAPGRCDRSEDRRRRCGCSRPSRAKITGRGGVPPSGRGVAYWSDGREKRVFLNTLDGRLISDRRAHRQGRSEVRRERNGAAQGTTDRSARADGRLLVAADRRRQRRRRADGFRSRRDQQGSSARPHSRLRRTHRQAPVDLPHDSAARRARRRNLGEGLVGVHRQHRRVDHDERRPRARLRLSADRNAVARFLRRPSARQQSLRREHRLPRREDRQARVALPDRASRRLGLRSARRADPRRHRR